MFGRCYGAINLIRLHSGEIEEENNEAPVFELSRRIRGGSSRSRRRLWLRCRAGQGCCLNYILGCYGVHILNVEGGDFLRLVVLENREVLRLEIAHEVSVFIADRYVHEH